MSHSAFRIALFDRVDSKNFPGGDTVQINAIETFLLQKGYTVTRFYEYSPNISEYDLAIGFNLTRPFEAYIQYFTAKKYEVPFIFFPIYWDLEQVVPVLDYPKNLKYLSAKVLSKKNLFRLKALKFWIKNKSLIDYLGITIWDLENFETISQKIFDYSAFICSNSVSEQQHLIKLFNKENSIIEKKWKVIYNGIENNIDILPKTEVQEISLWKYKNFICCLGGIGPRKNQLNLVKASNETGIPLIIVGKPSVGCNAYAELVKKEAGEQIFFAGGLTRSEALWVLERAKGHIQPSYIETPGLASLEASALGCSVGVSDVPPVREYFDDYVSYCNPSSIKSISDCMNQIYYNTHTKKIDDLRYHIMKNYTWDRVLEPINELILKIKYSSY